MPYRQRVRYTINGEIPEELDYFVTQHYDNEMT